MASETVRDEEARKRADIVDELLERVGHVVGHRAQASAVFGDAVQDGSVTVIPVARTRFGFGAGGGQGNREGEEGSGGGGGGGAAVTAIGFIEMRDGSAEFKRISTPMDWLALVAAASLALLTVKRLLG